METINAIEVKGLWAAYEDRMIIEEMNFEAEEKERQTQTPPMKASQNRQIWYFLLIHIHIN